MPSESNELSGQDNVVHYVRPTNIVDGEVDGTTFRPRSDELGPSVNWLEFFDGTKAQQLAQVREAIGIGMNPNGLLAELNVEQTKEAVQRYVSLQFVRSNSTDDTSHCEIHGLLSAPSAVYDLIAENITGTHPTV